MHRIAAESMVIGWLSRGMARSTSKTYRGTAARALNSAATSSASALVGRSPVSSR